MDDEATARGRGNHPEDLPDTKATRDDGAGTSASPAGVAPGGAAVERADERIRPVEGDQPVDEDRGPTWASPARAGIHDRDEPPASQFTGASGGYGVGSGYGTSGGSGSGSEPDVGGESQTDWLRSEETGESEEQDRD